jgi:MoaA/NifB/PqqE/SkfB family radical SAM enzyme
VGLAKLLLFPEKLASLPLNGPAGRDLSYPVSVELSLTNDCNQDCRWCSDRALRRRAGERLDLGALQRLFDDLAGGGVRGVTIEGGGEPTVSPVFEAATVAALERGLALGLITNGLDLFPAGRDPDIYGKFEWIRVSLDAAGRRPYRELKGVDGFDRVLANLGRLAESSPGATLGVGYVLTSRNDDVDELGALARILRDLGVDYLHIRPVVDHPELTSRQSLEELKQLETPDFAVNLAALADNEVRGNDGLPCLAHSLSAVIGAAGEVWLCGRLNIESSARPIGHLAATGFKDIWAGPERARQTALAAQPAFCLAHCPQCRMTKYNRLLADMSRLKTRNFI